MEKNPNGVELNCKNYCCEFFVNVHYHQLIGKMVNYEI